MPLRLVDALKRWQNQELVIAGLGILEQPRLNDDQRNCEADYERAWWTEKGLTPTN